MSFVDEGPLPDGCTCHTLSTEARLARQCIACQARAKSEYHCIADKGDGERCGAGLLAHEIAKGICGMCEAEGRSSISDRQTNSCGFGSFYGGDW